jgi:hypothetical protein
MEDHDYLRPRRPKKHRPLMGGEKIEPRRPKPEFEPAPVPPPVDLNTLKLGPEAVPQPLWGVALRTSLGDRWLPEVSRPVRFHQNTCEVCGGLGMGAPNGWRTCCHEVWDYSDADPVLSAVVQKLQSIPKQAAPESVFEIVMLLCQTEIPLMATQLLKRQPCARLVDLRCVCWRCNDVIHFGRTTAAESPERQEAALSHAVKVNKVERQVVESMVYTAKIAWMIRSVLPWTISWKGWERIRDRKSGKTPKRRAGWTGVPDSAFRLGPE